MTIEDDDYEAGRLIEALTLFKEREEAVCPPYYGYDCRWGGPDEHRWHTRNLYGKWDVVYRTKDGRRHRLYGPAYISKQYDIEEWFKDGEYHRIDGPAITHKNNEYWYKDGKRHRLDGPAVITGGTPKQYWIEGQRLPPKEYKKEIARRKKKGLIK
jgi:hypothetical protein